MDINRKEIYRYLGYHGTPPDDITKNLVESCILELENKITPRNLYQVFDLKCSEQNFLEFAGLHVTSQNLKKNLEGCSRIVLFAATLGISVDLLIKKYSKIKISHAVVLQAVATAMIEEYCDLCQENIRIEQEKQGFFLRPRFSPGYGDFSLEHQKDFVRILDCAKKIGLTLTDSLILIPSKSVTAVIGLSSVSQECKKKGCEDCGKSNCQFRKGE